MVNMEVDEICEASESSEYKTTKIKSMDEDKSEVLTKNISNLSNKISTESAVELAEQNSCIKISDFMESEKLSTVEISRPSIAKLKNSEGSMEASPFIISNSFKPNPHTSINDDSSSVDIYNSSVEIFNSSASEIAVSKEISKLVSDTCDAVEVIVNDDSSLVEIYNSSVDIFNSSNNETVVSEDICKLVSDTCDAVEVIVKDDSSIIEFNKSSVDEIAVSDEISKLVSDTCDAVEAIVNDNDTNGLNFKVATTDKIHKNFEIANDDLFDAEMGDDDDDNVLSSDNNNFHANEEMENSSELAECDSGDKITEMNEEDEECTNSFVETGVRDPIRRERHWTEKASLPYYREPKPDFFEYTRKLQEELDPKPAVISSTHTIVLDEPVEHTNQEFHLIKPSNTSGSCRNKTSTEFDISLKKRNGPHSEKPASGLIILDDYKSPRVKNSHFSRSSDIWNISTLQSSKEKPEPVPGSKYKALKEQLMEKIMLKKEESFNKRKEEQEYDEEKYYEEEEVVSDTTPYESENGLSDDDLDDDSPENAEDDVVLRDMLLKECQSFTDDVSGKTKDIRDVENSETEKFSSAIGGDSQEPMECYSLPSYQPGGGFSSSPLEKRSLKRIFSESDFNDSALNSPSQQRSKGRIFSDSDFIDSAPSESSGTSQLKKIPNLDFKDSADDQLLFVGSSEQEIIPHWESLPVSERQGSQLFDEDISVICSGKFPSTNEDIPWTPSSSLKNSLSNKESAASPAYSNHAVNETDSLSDSDDEELVRPAKKIKLSLVEKLWDSEDEDDVNPIVQNGELKGNHHTIQSDSDHDADLDNEPGADSEEEEELDDESEISQKHVTESHVQEGNDEESTKKFEINKFFENEAELSGEEGSSDENEDDADEYMDDEMITDEIVASEEKLRKEVGNIHFKRQQDEDDQLIRQIKNDFLPEGELYNENGQRKRRFLWNNIGMDNHEVTETKSDSEEEEVESLPTDYLKWQQEKNKSNLPEDDDVEIVQTPKSISLKVDIVGKVSVTRCSGISNSSISASPMVRRGSFLNSSIGKNSKFMKEFSSSEGSVSRKNFVFSSPQINASPLPSTNASSTPSAVVKSTKITYSINNRSIFNKI